MIAYSPTTSDVSIYTNKLEETVQLQGPVYTSKSLTIWGLLRPYRPHDASPPPRGTCTLGSATVTFSNLNVAFANSVAPTRDLYDVFIAKVDQNGTKCDIFLTTSGLPHIGGPLLASTHIIYTYDNGLVIYAERKPDKTWNILSPFPWDVGRMSQQVVRVDF